MSEYLVRVQFEDMEDHYYNSTNYMLTPNQDHANKFKTAEEADKSVDFACSLARDCRGDVVIKENNSINEITCNNSKAFNSVSNSDMSDAKTIFRVIGWLLGVFIQINEFI